MQRRELPWEGIYGGSGELKRFYRRSFKITQFNESGLRDRNRFQKFLAVPAFHLDSLSNQLIISIVMLSIGRVPECVSTG